MVSRFLFGGTKKNVCGGATYYAERAVLKKCQFRPFSKISFQPLQCPHLSCGGGEAMV